MVPGPSICNGCGNNGCCRSGNCGHDCCERYGRNQFSDWHHGLTDRCPQKGCKPSWAAEFQFQEKSDVAKATAEAAASAAGLDVKGSQAIQVHKDCIQGVKTATLEEKQEFWQYYCEIPESQSKYVVIKNGDYYCKICKKSGWTHITSGPHLKRLEDYCLSNMLAGDAETNRRWENTAGMQGRLDKKACYKFWGEALDNLPNAADTIFNEKKVLYINSRQNGTAVTLNMIRSKSLGMVSYKGNGKYDHSTFWHWHQVPDSEDNDPDYGDENLLWPPDGQGWWPVIAITLEPGCGVVPGGAALIICFYQLQADELIAWWIGGGWW